MNEHDADDAGDLEQEPHLWPFQKRVHRATPPCNCVDHPCPCIDRMWPLLKKAEIYHALRKTGIGEKAKDARVAFVRRLAGMGVLPNRANKLSWRLLEDALIWSEGEARFDVANLDAELEGMLAYGEERQYAAKPTEEAIAEALLEKATLFPKESLCSRLPTTTMHFYKRLGLWAEAERVLELNGRREEEFGTAISDCTWRFLAIFLKIHPTVDEIRAGVLRYLDGQYSQPGTARPR